MSEINSVNFENIHSLSELKEIEPLIIFGQIKKTHQLVWTCCTRNSCWSQQKYINICFISRHKTQSVQFVIVKHSYAYINTYAYMGKYANGELIHKPKRRRKRSNYVVRVSDCICSFADVRWVRINTAGTLCPSLQYMFNIESEQNATYIVECHHGC